jgi:hypothetical protein
MLLNANSISICSQNQYGHLFLKKRVICKSKIKNYQLKISEFGFRADIRDVEFGGELLQST